MKSTLCPCKSSKLYEACCGIFHKMQTHPKTAEQLMRSRYSAFCLDHIEYIIHTTHPKYQSKNLYNDIKNSLQDTQYLQLEIVSTQLGQENDKIGKVEFKAHFSYKQKVSIHHELSRFRRYKGKWVYTDGEIKS